MIGGEKNDISASKMGERRHMRRIYKYAIFLIAVVATLFVIELSLRSAGIDPTTDPMVMYQFDENLGWTTRHDYRYYRSSLYFAHFNYYNPEGLPTTADAWHLHASTTMPSIAILGSSFAESYYLPYDQSFPNLLEKKSGGKQVLNFGVTGYAPDQSLLRARAEFSKYDVKDVVIAFFPFRDLKNVVASNYNGLAKPMFGDGLERPVNTPLKQAPRDVDATGSVIAGVIRNTATYVVLRPYVRKAIAINLIPDSRVSSTHDPKIMDKALSMFAEIAREFPDKHVIVYEIPFFREMDTPQIYQGNLTTYREGCVKYALTCLSMDGIIKSHPRADELFIVGDGHVSAYGAKLIADELALVVNSPR